MSDAPEEILLAGINDANAVIAAIQSFEEYWRAFASACQAQQLDVAQQQGERLVALVESAVDLHLSSVRRIAQYERLTRMRDL